MTTIQPDITTPLVRNPVQPPVTGAANLGYLNYLLGTWNSPKGAAATGYNVMPLPQAGAPGGYVLKNFPYYEEVTFAPIAGGAPNRGGNYTQNSGVLFYEQRVFFATNPEPPPAAQVADLLVHAENGSWLYHNIVPQQLGPYGPGEVPPPVPLPQQPASMAYNKQISVPHGVSLLLVGSATPIDTPGNPAFTPTQRNMLPFTDPAVTDPVSVLEQQLAGLASQGITVQSHIRLDLNSGFGGAGINNILFEMSNAKVTWFQTTWFIEFLSNGKIQLQYVQTMIIVMMIMGQPTPFLHVDANTLQPAG